MSAESDVQIVKTVFELIDLISSKAEQARTRRKKQSMKL
jgi:hypothetical protein